MPDRIQQDPDRGSIPAGPSPLPARAPGALYPGNSTCRRPAATTRRPQLSRPTRPFGAPDLGIDIIASNPTDGDDQ
ncbi:hypothetical protein GCM10010193_70270 [Kitasatospora atroaurantiaca]|uniref:Uncharacterized protein n=1 Tax=Kitasatospora atroaurantiaca TaxID=285545 RepID=A0A561ENB4_9ACTN|nr:hypothetical protein [Kitasatospora atroaurantiaca]TWE17113.1 hypothetical protein FB465_2118 [Kitasatospora atroaurantiaca]